MLGSLKKLAGRVLGSKGGDTVAREQDDLAQVPTIACDGSPLTRDMNAERLRTIFAQTQLAQEWEQVAQSMVPLKITDQAGGVNPGDRRAIFYLVRYLQAKSILEVGTHIGASTVHLAAALQRNQAPRPGVPHRLVTVDIQDVNDPATRPWIGFGSTYAPQEMLAQLGLAGLVTFVTQPSLEFFPACRERFDLIFLDGSHAARTVYQEVPAALRLLNPGGLILLHDCFPDLRPLWSDGRVNPGPWLGIQRLRAEGAGLVIVPLGQLPWTTKLGTSVTSLALLAGT